MPQAETAFPNTYASRHLDNKRSSILFVSDRGSQASRAPESPRQPDHGLSYA